MARGYEVLFFSGGLVQIRTKHNLKWEWFWRGIARLLQESSLVARCTSPMRTTIYRKLTLGLDCCDGLQETRIGFRGGRGVGTVK